MSLTHEERRPRQDAATNLNLTSESIADLTARATQTRYVVRAVTTLRNGNVRVQHYVSLLAAERALERAQKRGCSCVLSLCRVTPVGLVTEDDLGGGGR